MGEISTLEVRKGDLGRSRLMQHPLAALNTGEILLRIERYALTTNNITYGVVGEKFGYWNFFPAGEGWGVIPVWGFADVIESRHPDVQQGERLYGYFPMATHLVMAPVKVQSERLLDGSVHRAALPPVYNSYARVHGESYYDPLMDDERMLLYPLYATSFCLYDFLADRHWFGARQVVILSASSKTAIGLAMALVDDAAAPGAIALTSPANLAMVGELDLYSRVHAYADVASIDASVPTVIVDMSGNGKALSALHAHLGSNMLHCANVGVTHYAENHKGPGYIAERSAMFFAPAHIQKRRTDWGPGVFEKKAFLFWHKAALRSRAWLKFDRFTGLSGMQTAYRRVLNGESAPDRGVVVAL